MAKGVYNYFVKRGRISGRKPKGCGTVSKGTKIKDKGEPDVRIKHCEGPKPKKTKKKTTKKKGKK